MLLVPSHWPGGLDTRVEPSRCQMRIRCSWRVVVEPDSKNTVPGPNFYRSLVQYKSMEVASSCWIYNWDDHQSAQSAGGTSMTAPWWLGVIFLFFLDAFWVDSGSPSGGHPVISTLHILRPIDIEVEILRIRLAPFTNQLFPCFRLSIPCTHHSFFYLTTQSMTLDSFNKFYPTIYFSLFGYQDLHRHDKGPPRGKSIRVLF